jgi:hypothetical protein
MFTFYFNSESFVAFNNATEKNDSYKEIKKKIPRHQQAMFVPGDDVCFTGTCDGRVMAWRFPGDCFKAQQVGWVVWVGAWLQMAPYHHINPPPPSPLVFLFSISSSSPPT